LPLLYRAKAAVIIGDPMQLKHISAISPRRDRQLLEQHGLTETHINWAFSENSVFDLASPLASSDDIVMLRDHHRSHGAIIGFSNEHFYEGRLRVATNYSRLNRPPGQRAVRWINVQGNVTRPGSGAMNDAEAQAVVRELERMVIQQGYCGSIGVVTPFKAQKQRIEDIIRRHPQVNILRAQTDLFVDTVHGFQGDERDVMIFSPVVSSGMPDGATGFLRKTGNLFNVAITRARAALVVVGDHGAARASGIEHLSAFADYVATRGG
jgi:superfamily I DNA and/or RNA helicase